MPFVVIVQYLLLAPIQYEKVRVLSIEHWGLTPLRKCYDSYISTMKRVDTFLVIVI